MKYKIYKPARKQLMEIWRYTMKNWGEEQANKYIMELHKAIEKVCLSHESWKKIDYENSQKARSRHCEALKYR